MQMKRGERMRGNFTRGLVLGSIIGASFGMMNSSGLMKNRTRRKIMRTGRNAFRRTGSIVGDMVDMFR